MKRSRLGHLNCSIARALDVVGEWWTLLVIRDVTFLGNRRFEAIQANLGIARNVLSDRLTTLVDSGVLRSGAGTRSTPSASSTCSRRWVATSTRCWPR